MKSFPPPLHFTELDSTNLELKRRLGKAEIGQSVVASWQMAGRGRGDHQWESPVGGLYFSILLKARPGRWATDLAFLGGAALADSLAAFGPFHEELVLKWPNDVLIGEKKIAGILAELERGGQVILGIGVNVSTPESRLKHVAGRFAPGVLARLTATPVTPPLLAEALLKRIAELYEWYEEEGFEPIRERWLQHCPWVGRRLQIAGGGSTRRGPVGEPWWGTMEGIDEDGALVLRDAENKPVTLISAEILACARAKA